MSPVALRRSARAASIASRPGRQSAAFPGYIEPCDPTLAERPPTGDDWLYEIKADGYCAQVHLHDGKVTVYSRRGVNWTEQFARRRGGKT
jgi:bifunctional non-homologous end joining protein LigD